MTSDRIVSHVDISEYRAKLSPILSRGLSVSVQTTGNRKDDEPYLFSFVPFSFTDDLNIKEVGKQVVMINPAKVPEGTDLSWTKSEDIALVKTFSYEVLQKLILNTEVVVSHNASFLYHFLIKVFPKSSFASTPFACTMKGISFKKKNVNSYSLEYLLYKYGFWYELEQEESQAIIRLLLEDGNFADMITRLFVESNKVILLNTKFSDKDKIKELGYSWNPDAKHWYKNDVADSDEEQDRVLAQLNATFEVENVSAQEKYKREGI